MLQRLTLLLLLLRRGRPVGRSVTAIDAAVIAVVVGATAAAARGLVLHRAVGQLVHLRRRVGLVAVAAAVVATCLRDRGRLNLGQGVGVCRRLLLLLLHGQPHQAHLLLLLVQVLLLLVVVRGQVVVQVGLLLLLLVGHVVVLDDT